jgi:hypothetical protein
MRQLYMSCVRSVMLYASPVWWCRVKAQSNVLARTQNAALRRVIGGFRTTPIDTVEWEAFIPPIDITLDHADWQAAVRPIKLDNTHPICRVANGPQIAIPQSKLERILCNCPTGVEPITPFPAPPWESLLMDPRICADLGVTGTDKRIVAAAHSDRARAWLDSDRNIVVYTDGSRLGGKVGCRFVVCQRNQPTFRRERAMGLKATVYDAEVEALSMAMCCLSEHQTDANCHGSA